MKVLIADDNAESLYMLESLLKGNGYVVISARDGREALTLLRQDPADMIITDILMPKMDGFQLCREVKADSALKDIPFIFYTATYTSEKDREFSLSLGASRFIVKPMDPAEFVATIRDVLAKGEQGLIAPEKPSLEKETEYLREHQERLFKKLEDKITQLEASEERYRSVIACAGDAIVTIDMDNRITSWNDAAETIFGYEADEIIGRDLSVLAPEELQAEQRELIRKLKERRLVGCLETVRLTKDGVLIPAGISLSLMRDGQGKEIGISAIIRDMTESKRRKEALQAIELKNKALIDAIPDMIFTLNHEGIVLEYHAPKEQLLYAPPEAFLGKNIRDVMPYQVAEAYSLVAEQVVRTGESRLLEYALDLPTGKYYFEAHIVAYQRHNILAVIRDITEHKRSEEALRNSEQFIEGILASVNEGFVVIDRDYRIISANRAYCEQQGVLLENVIGKHCYEITHHVTRPCHEIKQECACKQTFETGESAVSIHTYIDPAGEEKRVEIKSYAMRRESGEIQSIIEVINDITEKTTLEAQLRQAQKMEAVGQLAGGVAHDFNNILTAIIGYASLMNMKLEKDNPHRVNVDQILAASERAARLTHSLLAFSRKQILNPEPTDLNELVREVEKLLRRLISEDIELKIVLPGRPLTVMADPGQISQVLMNLATNARDAMPEGGIFTIEADAVQLDEEYVRTHDVNKAGPYAVLRVSDTGVGMDEKTREKIFDPFFTTKELGKGTGLGLAMVYGIVKQHNGHINVYSEPGNGTLFTVYLPLISAEVRKPQPKEKTAELAGTETVLLAEDDEGARNIAKTVLTEFGYSVIDAVDGEDALKRYTEQPAAIDLVVLDVVMPKKNGREVFDEIQRLRPGTKALFMSGYTAEIMHRRGIIEKGLPFISKPVSPTELLRKVREVLDEKREQ